MAVQQGRLDPTSTQKTMQDYYDDGIATTATDVTRGIHNGSDFVRLTIRRPQPITGFQGNTSAPDSLTEVSHYTDGFYTANPTDNVNLVVINYGQKYVSTTEILMYSTQPLPDTTVDDWQVSTSTDNTHAQYNNPIFQPAISTVDTNIDVPTGGYLTTLTIGLPDVDPNGVGMPYWRVTHTGSSTFSDATEIEITPPLVQRISYFSNNGAFKSYKTFNQPNILDACFDKANDVFYTIRFNDDTVGTTTLTLDDDFSDADAGTASGTGNDFNPARWVESTSNSQFLRSTDALRFNTLTGKGQLETTFTIGAGLIAQLDVAPTSLPGEQRWLALRALDTNNNTIMSEGIGVTTTTGVWFSSQYELTADAAAGSTLGEARPVWHNTTVGTDEFLVAYDGSSWSVSGTLSGDLSDATTGVLYDEAVDPNTPMEFLISSTSPPQAGHQFTFNLITSSVEKYPLSGGTLGIERKGTDYGTQNVLNDVAVASGTTDLGPVTIEIFGNSGEATINISGDDFTIVSGTATFPSLAVFTVEKTDTDAQALTPPVIESFDVIGDPSKNYNDYLDGRVQIAATATGTGGGFIYIKVEEDLYKYDNAAAIVGLSEQGQNAATPPSLGSVPLDGTNSFNWTHESGINGNPFLTYIEYDGLNTTHLKTIDVNTLQDTTALKEILLSVSAYEANDFKLFFDQNDLDTLYYVDANYTLQSFNIDDRLSAFMALNALDTTLPAGTAQQTYVNAEVINAWGEGLNGKTVTFLVTDGDGAVDPTTKVTASGGLAWTQFIVGSSVGVSTVTATVTEST